MWDVTPVFLCPSRNSALDFREHRDLRRLFAFCQSRFLPDRHLPQKSAETQLSPFAVFSWFWLASGSAPHPFSSTEIWKGDVGICIGHQKSESACFNKAWVLLISNLLNPESKSCRRFLLFARAEHMGCDLHDLKSASLHRNL